MPHTSAPLAAAVLFAAVAPALAQNGEAKKTPPPPNVITLSGCVAGDSTQRNAYTLTDGSDPTIYRLRGSSVRKYVGQRVEVSGVMSKRPVIVGGLYPTPNVAAQAGAIDPAKAAVEQQMAAAQNASGRPILDFRVKSVRAVPGACPEK